MVTIDLVHKSDHEVFNQTAGVEHFISTNFLPYNLESSIAHLNTTSPSFSNLFQTPAIALPMKLFTIASLVTNACTVTAFPQFNKRSDFDPSKQCFNLTGGDHKFVSPGPNDIRGPCPGLNALANQYVQHRKVYESSLTEIATSSPITGSQASTNCLKLSRRFSASATTPVIC